MQEDIGRQIIEDHVTRQPLTDYPPLRMSGRHAAILFLGKSWRAVPGANPLGVVIVDSGPPLIVKKRTLARMVVIAIRGAITLPALAVRIIITNPALAVSFVVTCAAVIGIRIVVAAHAMSGIDFALVILPAPLAVLPALLAVLPALMLLAATGRFRLGSQYRATRQ